MSESARLIELANARLKGGKFRVKLELQGKGDWIYIRATLPPKPDTKRHGNYQQRIALGIQALDQKSVDEAFDNAVAIARDVNRGEFDWRKFSDYEDTSIRTAQDLAEEWTRVWWRGKDRANTSHQNSWRTYRGCLKTLPKGAIDLDGLIDWVEERSNAATRRRGNYCTCARGIAKLLGLPIEPFKELAGGYSTKPVNPRELPSDEAIANVREQISDPGWQYIYGLMAAYGLRNHEAWFPDLSEFPLLRVPETAKTGARAVEPLYPEWAEKWRLDVALIPLKVTAAPGMANGVLGCKTTQHFRDSGIFTPYTLRHCFARRCAEFEIAPNVAARLMGHSTKMHEQVYQAWIGEKVFLDAARRATQHPDRPKPP
jgi:integrase